MSSAEKRVRKSISLLTKLQILNCLATGEKVSQVSRKFNVAYTTIISIKKNESNIRQAVVRGGGDIGRCRTSYVRDPLIEETEKVLLTWIDEQKRQGIQVTGDMIRGKALSIYDSLPANQNPNCPPKRKFCASPGWLAKFVKRYALRNVDVAEEGTPADVSDSSMSVPHEPFDHSELTELLVEPEIDPIEINGEHPEEFDQNKLGKLLKMSEKMIDVALDEDQNTERAMQFRRDLKKLMGSYRALYEQQSDVVPSDDNSMNGDECV